MTRLLRPELVARPLCAICGKPILGRSVPWHVRDERFESGRVFKVRKAHPECVGPEQPLPEAA